MNITISSNARNKFSFFFKVAFGEPSEYVDENLPFDISGHSYAESEVAEKLIVRLTKDQKIYADRVNKGRVKEVINFTLFISSFLKQIPMCGSFSQEKDDE